jgi:hypothetical protein
MLGRDLVGGAVRAPKDDRHLELPAGHIQHLGGVVDDLVGGEDREIECHELDNWPQSGHRRSDTDRGKTKFGDRGVDDSLVAELLPEPARDLVGAVVLGHLFTHDKDVIVPDKFLAKRLVQRISDRQYSHI